MLGLLSAVVLSLAFSASALVPHHGSYHRRHNTVHQNISYVPRSTSYSLVDHYQNDTFFE